MAEPWDDQFERLSATRSNYHNVDYWRFLVREVWRLERPQRVVDFGCGYGWIDINALIHLHETDEQDVTPLSFFQGLNATLRRNTGVDHNIGMKSPVLMVQAGLEGAGPRR